LLVLLQEIRHVEVDTRSALGDCQNQHLTDELLRGRFKFKEFAINGCGLQEKKLHKIHILEGISGVLL
jgi:hypothetical protein